jgi:hypothetical protein
MDYVKAQEDLIAAMKSWQDVTMTPDDPNQPQTFQQAQQQYNHIQDYLKKQQQGAVEPPQVMSDDMVGIPGLQFSPSGWGKAAEGFDLGRGISQIKGSTQGFLGRQFDIPEWVEASEEEKRVRDIYNKSEYDFHSAAPSWLQGTTLGRVLGPNDPLPGLWGGGGINPNLAQEPQSQEITMDLPGTWGDLSTGELSSLGESVVPMAAAVPVGVAAGIAGAPAWVASGAAGLLGMAPTIFGPMYERAMEGGMDHEDATWDAAARTTYEVVPEMLPFLKIFGPAGKTVLGHVAKVAGAEGASEVLTGWLNAAHDAAKSGEMPDVESILKDTVKN